MIRLNLGCGANVFPLPWVNVDFTDLETDYLAHLRSLRPEQVATWPEEQRKHVEWLQSGQLKFMRHDVRHGIGMYEAGAVEAVYLGQVVEHFNALHELPALLKECRRVLRPGGRIRITTPDINKLITAFLADGMDEFASEQPSWYSRLSAAGKLSAIMFGAGGDECTRENYEGHFVCWSAEDLIAALGSLGLPAHRADERSELFRECRDFGMSHSMALEATKP